MSAAASTPEFSFQLQHATDGKVRRIWGVASTEAQDRDREIIEEEAISKALKDFMALPIIHWYHTERPIGWITKAQNGDVKSIIKAFGLPELPDLPKRGLVVVGEIKNTPDTDDIWDGIEKGKISEWSIFATRRQGSPECRVPAPMRTSPCITKALWLWSCSLCPLGTARNRTTFTEIVKAMTSGSALIHPTVDGTIEKRRTIQMAEPVAASEPGGTSETPSGDQTLQEIHSMLKAILERLEGGDSGIKGPTANPVAKAADCPKKGSPADDETIEKCRLSTIKSAIQKADLPWDECIKKMEDEGHPKDHAEKICGAIRAGTVKKADTTPGADPAPGAAATPTLPAVDDDTIVKAQADRIAELEAENTVMKARIPALENELTITKSRVPTARTIVMDPKMAGKNAPPLDPKKSTMGRLATALSRRT